MNHEHRQSSAANEMSPNPRSPVSIAAGKRPQVVVVGAGFGGLNVAKKLAGSSVDVILIDRRNHHLFQPLLYQVATASLNPADIACPIRKIFRHEPNIQVILGEVTRVDMNSRKVFIGDYPITYDYLVLAVGATHSYFQHDEWRQFAPGLKTLEDATDIRARFLLAFEEAEMEADPQARKAALTFVVVGAGPTGVELAGTLAEIAHTSIPADFRAIDTTTARVILIEGSPRILPSFPETCSADALRQLDSLGVEIMTGTPVTRVDEHGVVAGSQRIDAASIFWAAGVDASPLGKTLGVTRDRAGRVIVESDLSVPGHPEVFAIGDFAHAVDPITSQPIPGVAPAAIQMGHYVALTIRREIKTLVRGGPLPRRPRFCFHDKGSLATIGRRRAVAFIHGRSFKGIIAWLLWAVVHLLYIIGFRNRLAVMWSWMWTYLFFDRGARLITGQHTPHVIRPRSISTADPWEESPVGMRRDNGSGRNT